jgi:hypothetical protein
VSSVRAQFAQNTPGRLMYSFFARHQFALVFSTLGIWISAIQNVICSPSETFRYDSQISPVTKYQKHKSKT